MKEFSFLSELSNVTSYFKDHLIMYLFCFYVFPGYSNMGPSPLIILPKIRNLFGYKPSIDHTQEELLG